MSKGLKWELIDGILFNYIWSKCENDDYYLKLLVSLNILEMYK